jgi:3-deoxy-D-manno-octulosonic-acid transferase
MILIYRILSNLIYPLLFIFLYLRKILNKESAKRYKEKIFVSHFNVTRNEKLKLIWFHAASIGEFKSILPIIKEFNTKNDKFEFLITTTTLSSGNLAAVELKSFKNVKHRFFPLDVNFLINKFLYLWKPSAIFLVDSEIWPNLILNAKKFKIPLAIINARLTLKTFNKWAKFPKTSKQIFSSFDLCLASNLETVNFLKKFNAKNIFFNGNIKLINKIDVDKIKDINDNILIKSRFWLAASTHKGEDDLCLKTHLSLKEKYNDILTIIAPRHIDRVQEVKALCKNYNLNAQILNSNDKILDNSEIIIINSFGVLQNYFKHAISVFMGKSTLIKLKNVGGQNPIDAAKLGCKIYHGPYVYNFEDIYKILEKNKISKKIGNYSDLSDNLIEDFKISQKHDRVATSSIKNIGQKTLTDTMKYINNFLSNEIN